MEEEGLQMFVFILSDLNGVEYQFGPLKQGFVLMIVIITYIDDYQINTYESDLQINKIYRIEGRKSG